MNTETILKAIISKILQKDITNEEIREMLYKVDPEATLNSENQLCSDAYFSLKHFASGEEDITNVEWNYLLKCFNGEEKFSFASKMRQIRKSMDKTKRIDSFVAASLAADRAQKIGNARIVNENLERAEEIREELREELKDDLAAYKSLFTPLLEHETPYVRLNAAYALLPVLPKEAETVLEEVSKGTGLTASKARKVLKEWREGDGNI